MHNLDFGTNLQQVNGGISSLRLSRQDEIHPRPAMNFRRLFNHRQEIAGHRTEDFAANKPRHPSLSGPAARYFIVRLCTQWDETIEMNK
ncbi:MAG: hypothetical protein Q7U44_09765 [Desulfuromonadales bacterium]|nr:hypothetical protein [Desulfuromonadales bacterium]